MSVLLVVGQVAGGAGRHVHELAGGLGERGWQVRVACPAEVEQRFGFAALGAQVLPVEIGERPSPRADLQTVRALRAAAADSAVIHAHGLRAAVLACLAARRVVVTLHNTAPAGAAPRRIFGLLARLVARRAAVVLAVAPDLADQMRRLGARDVRAAVVAAAPGRPPRRAAADVRRELGSPRRLALTVGRLAPQKDLDLLLDAVARLDPALGLVVAVAGDGPGREHLAERIEQERLPVRLLGSRDDVPDLLMAADLVISSARWEGQPVWLQEAIRAGRAVVATDVGGTEAVVGAAGVLVPHGDPQRLAEAISVVCTDDQLRDSLSAEALSQVSRLPSRAAAIAAVERVYAEVDGMPPTSTATDDVG